MWDRAIALFWAPSTFDLDDEGLAVVTDPNGDDEDRIRVAVDGCPSKALALTLADVVESGTDPGEGREEDHGHRPVR